MKSALTSLSRHINPKEMVRKRFKFWKALVLSHRAARRNPQILKNMGKSLIQKVQNQEDMKTEGSVKSDHITFTEQKLHSKLTSFMKIHKLMMEEYIAKGTILQKYIDNLKFLAQQQS